MQSRGYNIGMERPGRNQFSLKAILGTVTLVFVALPLLPFLVLFGIWYVTDPVGLFSDAIYWLSNRHERSRASNNQ